MTVSKASLSKIQYTTPIDDLPDGPTLSASDVGTSRAFNNGSATITATNALTGGGNITSYNVVSSPGSFTASGASPLTVTGLQSNTSYTFTATATNAKGVSPFSGPASSAITATTVPDAPIIGTATRVSNTVVSLTFTPPAATGGSAVTGYVIESSPSVANLTTQAGTTSPLTATGTFLGSSESYTLTIKAVNANGTGLASSASNSVIPKTSSDAIVINYLVIAGGGSETGSGGGGAGGYRTSAGTSGANSSAESPLTLNTGVNYTVTVGGTNSNSVFSTITSLAGGNGGQVGGSGGATVAGTANQGMAGGSSSGPGTGGGGGAGQVGAAGGPDRYAASGGAGGNGLASSITGSSVTRAGGGGGSTGSRFAYGGSPGPGGSGGGGQGGAVGYQIFHGYAPGISSTAGAANTGSGGSGGGSGIVILKYPDDGTITVGAGLTGSTSEPSGGYKVTTITAGTGNVSWQ